MSQHTCLIVEDEPLARNLLTDYVNKVPFLNLIQACSSPMDALEVLRTNAVDILFLDIQMPEITGITLLKILQKKTSCNPNHRLLGIRAGKLRARCGGLSAEAYHLRSISESC